MKTSTVFHAGRFKNGSPSFWEKRKHNFAITLVELVCNYDFTPLRPCFLNRDPKIDKNLHMMFVIDIGHFIVRAVRNNTRNKIVYTLYVITDIKRDENDRFSIVGDEIFSSELFDDFEEKFGEDIIPVLEAALNKLDSETVDSNFTQPHKLYEKTALKESSNK